MMMKARPPIGPYCAPLVNWSMNILPAAITHLLQQQFPVDAHSSLLVLPAVFPQPTRNISHPFQTIATIQEILNVFGHDLCHILQLVVQLVEVLRCS